MWETTANKSHFLFWMYRFGYLCVCLCGFSTAALVNAMRRVTNNQCETAVQYTGTKIVACVYMIIRYEALLRQTLLIISNLYWEMWKHFLMHLINSITPVVEIPISGVCAQTSDIGVVHFPANVFTPPINPSLVPCPAKSTPVMFLTWCRSPGSSLRPSPLWTSLPSSSRWVGWRHRCSRKTPGKSGSTRFLQRQEATGRHARLSRRPGKDVTLMRTTHSTLHHVSASESQGQQQERSFGRRRVRSKYVSWAQNVFTFLF